MIALLERASRLAVELRHVEELIAAAVVAEVSAVFPTPWSHPWIGHNREASIEVDGVTIAVCWSDDGWMAYATGPSVVGEYVEGLPAPTPREALEQLRRPLARGSKSWRVTARSVVVRLLRGWM